MRHSELRRERRENLPICLLGFKTRVSLSYVPNILGALIIESRDLRHRVAIQIKSMSKGIEYNLPGDPRNCDELVF